MAETVKPDHIDASACRDKHNLPVIGTATRGDVELIVTGDADLLALKSYRGIDLITPGIMESSEMKNHRPCLNTHENQHH
jgi:predicted nucleic acid-binding protein